MKRTLLFLCLIVLCSCVQTESVLKNRLIGLDSADPDVCAALFSIDNNGQIVPEEDAVFPANLVIPLEVDGKRVKAVSGCSALEIDYLLLQGGLSVAPYAFSDCTGLRVVVVGKEVREIGRKAFDGCDSVTRVVINSPSVRIDVSAFSCTEAEFVYMDRIYSDFEEFRKGEAGLWQ